MVEANASRDPLRPGYYLPEELQFMETGASHWRVTMRSPVWRPPTDMFETEDAVIVRVEIAGMREDDFNLALEDRLLTIRGARPDQPERRAYHQMEIRFGEFVSEVELPAAVVAEEVEATYSDGFLRVVLPKARPQSIHIEE